MKNLIAAVVILLSPVGAIAQQMPPMPPTITVQGEALSKYAPTQAVLPVTVQTHDPVLKTAKQKNDEKVTALLALAAKYGVGKEQMRTAYTTVQPEQEYNPQTGKSRVKGYQALTNIEFTFWKMDQVAPFMDEVVKSGIDTVGSLQFSLKDDQAAREETMLKALQNASKKAKAMATTLGVTLGRVVQVTEGGSAIQPPRPMMMMAKAAMMESDMAAPELPGGLIEVRQTVSASFEIK